MSLNHNRKVDNVMKEFFVAIIVFALSASSAQAVQLIGVDFGAFTDSSGSIKLTFDGPAPKYRSFTIDNPPRVAIDFMNTGVGNVEKKISIMDGGVKDIAVVGTADRSRIVVSVTRIKPYQLQSNNNEIYISFDVSDIESRSIVTAKGGDVVINKTELKNMDFRRGVNGEGFISIDLNDPSSLVDVTQDNDKLKLKFINSRLPEHLQKRFDVTDFATNVLSIDGFNSEDGAHIIATMTGDYDYLGYQTGNIYTIEVKGIDKKQQEKEKKEKYGYVGERLSLNFQNIEVRAVLQLLADFTGLNVVASDTVQGNITLRLKNVPWDQALDIILKTRGLGMRQTGNVLLIAPNSEITTRERQELEAQNQIEQLAPLITEYFVINYAKASDIAGLLKGSENSLLSDRGNITLDERTNTLMISDTREKLNDVTKLIDKLDVPVKQVLIETRIVTADDSFSRALGMRTGFTYVTDNGSDGIISTSASAASNDGIVSSAIDNLNSTGSAFPVTLPSVNDRLNVNLPVGGATGQIALAILSSDYLVDLELSAMQTEGNGEVISSPRVITSNQKEAVIEQGDEIPYQEASSSGATSVSFKKAVLSLSVTPQITPDNKVIMDLQVNKDAVGEAINGVPTINTRSVQTQVLVSDGETVVLGGIYEQTRNEGVSKVPLLGDIPVLGHLFKRTTKQDDKSELLIFVTPKILKDGMSTTF